MDIFKVFATDPNKELNGTWVPLSEDGAKLLVARAGNRRHTRLMNGMYAANRMTLEGADREAADSKDEELSVECAAQAILLGWESLTYQGKPIEYSLENARRLLKHSEFRVLVMTHANNFENFRAKEEQDRGND